jgi:FMN phosphatase YigB (HAD superfamily)
MPGIPPRAASIRVITFDWGDTLAANHGMPYLATQRRAFGRLASDLAELGGAAPIDFVPGLMSELAESWHASTDPVRNPDHREFDFGAMVARWVDRAGGARAEPHRLGLALERCHATLADTVPPFAEAQPTLALLKARGYRLGILSHVPWTGPACRAWFARHGLAPYLDFYSLSCEVGWIKPHPRHYQDALDQAGCAAAELLHVGDHPERDISGAQAFGFRACLRLTENLYPAAAFAACRPDAEILHLDELLGVVQELDRRGGHQD